VSGSASGGLRVVLRAEGACLLAVSLLAYAKFSGGWGLFALCFLAPDLAFLGYLAGPRVGAAVYNVARSTVGALALLALGVLLPATAAITAGLIWLAHIGFDRALGYGLKSADGFGFTHLGRVGRAQST
jgi:hypothetical protein